MTHTDDRFEEVINVADWGCVVPLISLVPNHKNQTTKLLRNINQNKPNKLDGELN